MSDEGLTAKESALLQYLKGREGEVVSRDELLEQVWRYKTRVTRTVDMHVALLRRKLALGRIVTVRGKGYRFL